MWRSLIDKFNRKDRKRGYTMTELLAVLGIIAVAGQPDQLRSCLTALERIKENHKPAAAKNAFDYERVETATRATSTDAVADEISASLQALVGTTDDEPPIAEAKHPVSDTTGKFDRLMFGPNYNPTEK